MKQLFWIDLLAEAKISNVFEESRQIAALALSYRAERSGSRIRTEGSPTKSEF
jgi:hypothetical protein